MLALNDLFIYNSLFGGGGGAFEQNFDQKKKILII